MAVREIRVYGDPVLRREAEPVESFDDELRAFVQDMVQTMLESDDGIGLAAPQVGLSRRVLVIGLPPSEESVEEGAERRIIAMINPEILEESEDTELMDEGCLSLPGLVAEEIERPASVKVRFQKLDGEEVVVDADGFLARVIQHELDHLNGVLIIDHLPALKRSLLRGQLKKLQKQAKEAEAHRRQRA
jgi:peptide deformylase